MKFLKLFIIFVLIIILATEISSCSTDMNSKVWIVGDFDGKEDFSMSMKVGCEYLSNSTKPSNRDDTIECVEKSFSREEAKKNSSEIKKIVMDASHRPEVLAIIGLQESGFTIEAQKLAGPLNVPIFAPVATNTKISYGFSQNGFRNFYRLVATDEIQAKEISKFVLNKLDLKPDIPVKNESKYIVIIRDNSPYGVDLGGEIEKEMKIKLRNINGKKNQSDKKSINVQIEMVNIKSEESIEIQLNKYIKNGYKDIDFIIFAGYTNQAFDIIKHTNNVGYDKPMLLTDGSYEGQFLQKLDVFVNELKSRDIYISSIAPDWSRNKDTEGIYKYYTSNSSLRVNGQKISPRFSLSPYTADAINIIRSIKDRIKSKKVISKKTIIEEMQENIKQEKEFNVGLLNCNYKFDQKGDNSNAEIFFFLVRKKDDPRKPNIEIVPVDEKRHEKSCPIE
jgi:ABC-type branched-subunit amino acid transport system substrate-binding protein